MNRFLQLGDGIIFPNQERTDIGVNIAHVTLWYWSGDDFCIGLCNGQYVVLSGEQADRASKELKKVIGWDRFGNE